MTDQELLTVFRGQMLGHTLGGDRGRPSCLREYEKWVSASGLRALTDPAPKTSATGLSRDELLRLQGGEVPDASFRGRAAEVDGGSENLSFPRSAAGSGVVWNHHLIFFNSRRRGLAPN